MMIQLGEYLMADVEHNKKLWGEDYDWKGHGDEWSELWGGSDVQWYGSILPRIQQFLPAGNVLEIAPGFGRWTQWLRQLADDLVVVDLSEKCIEFCRKRFAGENHISYFVNDGTSLEMIRDQSLDFVFSYDSLVHAEVDVMREYVCQLAKKLAPNGVTFIHHSNIGVYKSRMTELLSKESDYGRAFSVTAENVREMVNREGLACLSQEIFNWGGELSTDCITVFSCNRSIWDRPCVTLTNDAFMEEAAKLKQISELYGKASFARSH